jgi:hypothetical protein
MALALPAGKRFWRAHPRLRLLPERTVDADGRPALVSGFESAADGARLEVLFDAASFRVLAVHGAPGT